MLSFFMALEMTALALSECVTWKLISGEKGGSEGRYSAWIKLAADKSLKGGVVMQ